jgi:exodeoxyribonuclease VII small subunit
MTTDTPLSFEVAYTRLEEILEKMNSGKVSLEDSLKLYEDASRLITWCSKQLTDAEKKIEILVKNKDLELQVDPLGRPMTQPFATTTTAPLNRQPNF